MVPGCPICVTARDMHGSGPSAHPAAAWRSLALALPSLKIRKGRDDKQSRGMLTQTGILADWHRSSNQGSSGQLQKCPKETNLSHIDPSNRLQTNNRNTHSQNHKALFKGVALFQAAQSNINPANELSLLACDSDVCTAIICLRVTLYSAPCPQTKPSSQQHS